jgi:N-formylmaleamate deformylase
MTSTFRYGANVHANGIRQHYLRFGRQGPAMVVVPGIISTAAMWAFVAERLGLHFNVYVLDVRGRGLSESGAHLDYGLDACAQDVLAFAAVLGLAPFTILGHSMGARIAIRAARRPGPTLERIVLVDPPVSGPGRRKYPSPLDGILELLHAAYRGQAYEALKAPGVPAWPEALLRVRAEWLHTCDERAVVDAYRGLHEDDIHADLPHVRVPAALIAAGKGDVIMVEEEHEIVRLLPSIAVRRVANAGHNVPVDDFEGFFAALGSILGAKL